MSKPKVYLAGPIAGLMLADADHWRSWAAARLAPEIAAFNPLRGKWDNLPTDEPLTSGSYDGALVSARGILTRDHYDCLSCDAILVNLLGAKQISIGTVMEIAWGHAYRKPIIAVMGPLNIHEHVMLREAIDYRVGSLQDAIFIARSILLPDDNN